MSLANQLYHQENQHEIGVDGWTEDDNLKWRRLERMNRYVSMSRRSSLFFGSHAGAQRAAIFYSLACSCRMCEVNFFDYFTDVISKVSQMNPFAPSEQFRGLLPDRWSKAQ